MRSLAVKLLCVTGAVIALAAVAPAFSPGAAATTPLPPNLKPLRAFDMHLNVGGDGHTYLRFATESWNSGTGPLEIIGGAVDNTTGEQQVFQRIYNSDGTSSDTLAGSFVYHPGHGHIHFDDYALYTLTPVAGGSEGIVLKTTFCIIDTDHVKRSSPSPKHAVYTTCGSQVQGMSVGWGDTYGSHLEGQAMDVTALPDGDYILGIEIDPQERIIETDESDNTSTVLLRLATGRVTLLDGKPGNRPPR